VAVSKRVCEQCGAFQLAVEFSSKSTPLPDGVTKYVGCLMCDSLLSSLSSDGTCAWACSVV
jgi:hypothetical protein